MSAQNNHNGGQILLVEDDPGVCRLEAERLEPLGRKILSASTAEEAMALLRSGTPELMLLDYSLPGHSALELITRLRRESVAVPPFIVVTGLGDETVAVETMKAGALDYVVKNSAFLDNLLETARKALDKSALQRKLEKAEADVRKNLRLYEFLAQVNQAAFREKDRVKLLTLICDIAVKAGGLRMAWAGRPDKDTGRVLPLCSAGFTDGYLNSIKINLAGGKFAVSPMSKAAAHKRIATSEDIATDPDFKQWREAALTRGYGSSAAIPLMEGGRLYAVLGLYASEPGFFTGDEMKLLEEIQGDVSLALDAISAEENRAAAQAALERTAAQLSHVMDANPVILFTLAGEPGKFACQWISGNAEQMLGYEPAEVLMPDWWKNSLHPADRERVLAEQAKLAQAGSLIQDFRIRRKDGDYFWVHSQLKVSADNKSEVNGSWSDITRLKDSEESYKLLFDANPQPMWVFDRETTRFLEVNQAAIEHYGYTREEFLAMTIFDIRPESEHERLRRQLPIAPVQTDMTEMWRHRRKDGTLMWVNVAAHTLQYMDRPGVLILALDMTSKVEAEKRLKESEERFREMFEKAPIGYMALDADGNLTAANETCAEIFGQKAAGAHFKELMTPESAARAAEEFARFKDTGAVQNLELDVRRPDGSTRHISLNGRVGRGADGSFKQAHCVFADITETWRTRAENEMLSQAVKASADDIYIIDIDKEEVLFFNHGTGKDNELKSDLKERIRSLRERLSPLLAGEVSQLVIEDEQKRGDGTPISVEARIQLVKPGIILSLVSDITERKKAGAKLAALTEQHNKMLATSPDGILLVDSDFRIVAVNRRVMEMLGRGGPEESLSGLSVLELLPEEQRGRAIAMGRKLLAEGSGELRNLEFDTVRNDGTLLPVELGVALVNGADGRPDGLLITSRDITERKLAQEKAAELDRQYKYLFNNMLDAVAIHELVYDPEGKPSGMRFLSVNAAYLSSLGFKDESAIAGRLSDEVFTRPDPFWRKTFAEVVATGKPVRLEHLDSMTGRFLSVAAIPAGGRKVAAFFRDITDAETARRSLQESEARFKVLVDSTTEGLIVRGEDRTVLFANKAALALFGASDERELAGLDITDRLPEDMRETFRTRMAEIDSKGITTKPMQARINRLNGGVSEVEMSGAPITFGGQRCAVVFLRDVSERIKAERLLSEMTTMQRVESLGALAGGIAHDFNNMLTGIMANLSLLGSRARGKGENTEIIDETVQAARNAQNLTASLLAFSKGGKPVKKEFDLARAVRDIFSLSTRGTSAACEVSVDAGLWSVQGDRSQLNQAFNNIILNALQAMPSGGRLRLEAANFPFNGEAALPLEPGKYVRIKIKDTGLGISRKHLDRIFDPYFTTKSEGHGLGLSMTWSVIKNHGGHITVDSEPGKGTEFRIYLPATGNAPAEEQGAPRQVLGGSGRVLVLEDEEVVRRALRRMLKQLGYEAEFTEDGNETIRLYKEAAADARPFDVVIMDLTIPGGLGGKEAVKGLREIAPAAKVIVSSGYSDEPVMSDYVRYGFDAVLPKPYKYEELAEILSRILKGGGAGA